MTWKKLQSFFKKRSRKRRLQRKQKNLNNLNYLGKASSDWLREIVYQKEGY